MDPDEKEIWWSINHAAVQIQRVYRGHRNRLKLAMSFADIVKLLSFQPKEAEIPKSHVLSPVATLVEAKNPSPNSTLNMNERLSSLESMQRRIMKNVTEMEERMKEQFQHLLRNTQEGESQSPKNAVEDRLILNALPTERKRHRLENKNPAAAETLALPRADLKSTVHFPSGGLDPETTKPLFKIRQRNGDGSFSHSVLPIESESQSSSPKRYARSHYNRPRAGQPNRRYDKKKHKQQIEELHFLRQREECTFAPALYKRKGPRGIRKHRNGSNVFDRLQSKGQKRAERRKKRFARQSCSMFSFSQNTLATSKSTPAISSAATFQRLYANGKKHREKREKIHLNRPKPEFKPELSPTKTYFEKHWYHRENRKKTFRTRKAVERGSKTMLPPLPSKDNTHFRRREETVGPLPSSLAMKSLSKIFLLLDSKEKRGMVSKQGLLKGWCLDPKIHSILSGNDHLSELRKPKVLNEILSTMRSRKGKRYVRYSEFIYNFNFALHCKA